MYTKDYAIKERANKDGRILVWKCNFCKYCCHVRKKCVAHQKKCALKAIKRGEESNNFDATLNLIIPITRRDAAIQTDITIA
jgi:hypothetical protein